MIEIKKQVSLDINIDQDDLEQLIKDAINKKDPSIVVTDIQFVQKRKPTNTLEVQIEAHIDGCDPAPKKEKLLVEDVFPSNEKEDEDEEEESTPEPTKEKPVSKSLFSD